MKIKSRRSITKFLFLPKTIRGETKWLVRARWVEEYQGEIVAMDMLGIPYPEPHWLPVEWIPPIDK